MTTAVAAPDHDPRPIRMLVLEEAITIAIARLLMVNDEPSLRTAELLTEALREGSHRG